MCCDFEFKDEFKPTWHSCEVGICVQNPNMNHKHLSLNISCLLIDFVTKRVYFNFSSQTHHRHLIYKPHVSSSVYSWSYPYVPSVFLCDKRLPFSPWECFHTLYSNVSMCNAASPLIVDHVSSCMLHKSMKDHPRWEVLTVGGPHTLI